ncbi:MAG: TadE/TadG family type IV pilus assembly protein [Candidatus Deferrimicrobiaceae bacterium]
MGAKVKPTGKTERGQGLVEFALLVPIMLLLVIGIAEFGRAWMMRNILTGAAREGARVAAVEPDSASSINQGRAAAIAVLSSAGISVPPATVIVDPSPPTPFNAVQVDVTYTYSVVITGFIPGLPASFPLTGTATMRRERY